MKKNGNAEGSSRVNTKINHIEGMRTMTITTRRLDQETYNRAEKYLQQVGKVKDSNVYSHFVMFHGGSDDGKVLDAIVQLKNNTIAIKHIWVMEHCPKEGKGVAKNPNGEKGRYAKLLGEKYLNRFFDHLSTVDINNIVERQFTITADLIKQVEEKIDQSINPKHITEEDINAYNRIEITQAIDYALRFFCKGFGEEDYRVSYDGNNQIFEVEMLTSELSFDIPLADIVRRKWEIRECIGRASISCAGDLYAKADERKKRDEHYIKQLLDKAIPNIRKAAGDDQENFEHMKEHFLWVINAQITLYDLGRADSKDGCTILNWAELVSEHDWLESIMHIEHLVEMLHGVYRDGFKGTNGDTLFSGTGNVRLPFVH